MLDIYLHTVTIVAITSTTLVLIISWSLLIADGQDLSARRISFDLQRGHTVLIPSVVKKLVLLVDRVRLYLGRILFRSGFWGGFITCRGGHWKKLGFVFADRLCDCIGF